MNIPVLTVEHRWWCPKCDFEDVTHEVEPHSRMHQCRGMAGLTTPMVPYGEKAKVTAHDREDYVGHDLVQRDGEGQVVMAVSVERDEGEDRTVYAPTAGIDLGAHDG